MVTVAAAVVATPKRHLTQMVRCKRCSGRGYAKLGAGWHDGHVLSLSWLWKPMQPGVAAGVQYLLHHEDIMQQAASVPQKVPVWQRYRIHTSTILVAATLEACSMLWDARASDRKNPQAMRQTYTPTHTHTATAHKE
jgi:hypothetical protein